jgi:hypothetical protein
MREVLRRIAIHGGLTALFLGILGIAITEFAARAFLAPTQIPVENGRARMEVTVNTDQLVSELRRTMPIRMAIMGFGIIAVFEVSRHLWRGRKKPAPSAPPAGPDETEKLLEELLRQAESKNTDPSTATPAPVGSPVVREAAGT